MSLSKRWIIFGLVSSSLWVGVAALYGERFFLTPYWIVPLAVAGALGAFFVGTQRVSSPSMWRRSIAGGLCALLWTAILFVPWAVRSGFLLWSAHSLPAPPGASYVIAPGDDVEYGPFGTTDVTGVAGFQVVWKSDLAADDVEHFYRERLPRRGWRFQWRRDVVIPVSGEVVRMLCFRRADGFLILRVADSWGRSDGFGLVYDHFASERSYD